MERNENFNLREYANAVAGPIVGAMLPVLAFRTFSGLINYGIVEVPDFVSMGEAIRTVYPISAVAGVGAMFIGMCEARGLYLTRMARENTEDNPELL